MAKESDDSGEQSVDDIKEEVRSLEEKLAKQQKLTDQMEHDEVDHPLCDKSEP